ncbi:MAG: CBS domain-containing protein, partial [Fusobacterium sp.]
DELLEIQSEVNKTIIFITHDLNEALKIGDRIALMKDGEVVQIGTPEDILLKPANEYVRKFINDVDRTKILTASRIMKNPVVVARDKDSVELVTKKMNKHKFDSIFVVDENKKLLGLLRKNKIKDNVNEENIMNLLDSNFTKIDENVSIDELFVYLANSNEPIAVTSESDKLIGIIIRSDIIQFLAERRDIDE